MQNKINFYICILLFSACKHELEKPTWDVDLLVPLIHSEMSINDMLSDSTITINEDEDLFIEGEVVGTFDFVREDETDEIIFIDFKVDGVLSVIRFKIEHVVSIREYNYEKKSKL